MARALSNRRVVVDGVTFQVQRDRETSQRLAGVKRADTEPERAVRATLVSLGWRCRATNRDLPGSPDLTNRPAKWAVFVHGCFWHRHAGCYKATTPKRNTAFWLAKFENNVARDRRAARALRREGYRVIVVWECQTRDPNALRRRLHRLVGRYG
jgi:DNA mismatch endonuclease (patch repair protein)